jgi:hypothetical protein|tara:strand:- start:71 stop:595 length:525 start_codon:yes stop_codon:yes gene_type:complete
MAKKENCMMTLAERQDFWDFLLVSHFHKKYCKMGSIIYKYVKQVKPDLLESNGTTLKPEAFRWMDKQELQRCRSRHWDGELVFNKYKLSVVDFIGRHSLTLMMALYSKDTDNMEVYENIKLYKWVRVNDKVGRKRQQARKSKSKAEWKALNPDGMLFVIDAKSRDKRTSWGTVK